MKICGAAHRSEACAASYFQNFSIPDKQQLALEEIRGPMCGSVCAVPGRYWGDRMWRQQQLRHHSTTANCNGFTRCDPRGHSVRWNSNSNLVGFHEFHGVFASKVRIAAHSSADSEQFDFGF
jgi:hypothetical protein